MPMDIHPGSGQGRLRVVAALLALLLCCACAADRTYEPILPAGSMVDAKNPRKASEESRAVTDEATRRAETEATLQKLGQDNERLNRRLQTATAEPGRARGKGAAPAAQRGGERKEVKLDFLDAEVAEVVRLFMETLGDNYLIHPGITGTVALKVNDQLTRDEIVELLQGVLRIHGAAMVREQSLWRVLPLAEAPAYGLADVGSPAGGPPRRGQLIEAFRLNYLAPTEFLKLAQPFLTKGAQSYGDDKSGFAIVGDFPHVLARLRQMAELFDESAFAEAHLRAFLLRWTKADDMAKELGGVAQAAGLATPQGPAQVSFVALERMNVLFTVARSRQILDFVQVWVEELDRELPQRVQGDQAENIFVYYAQNGDAEAIVEALDGIFGGGSLTSRKRQTDADRTTGQTSRTTRGDTTGTGNVSPSSSGSLGSTSTSGTGSSSGSSTGSTGTTSGSGTSGLTGLGRQTSPTRTQQPRDSRQESSFGNRRRTQTTSGEGDISFVVDRTTNSIITRCSGQDYKTVLGVIEKLDIFPKQVLVEVVIAEVALDDETRLGIEWQSVFNLPGSNTLTTGVDNNLGIVNPSASNIPIASGLSAVNTGSRVVAALKAVATENKSQILSTPYVLTSNHKEARIDIGQEVPILTSETTTRDVTDPTGTTATEQVIQYRNTGLLLSVIPHINNEGLIRLEISQEVSAIAEQSVQGISSPVFTKRLATSEVVVDDEQTIVIGGLIEQRRTDTSNNVPFVRRIPLIKYLFGVETDRLQSTELLIFITPHVVESKGDNEFISKNFVRRLQLIKQDMLR